MELHGGEVGSAVGTEGHAKTITDILGIWIVYSLMISGRSYSRFGRRSGVGGMFEMHSGATGTYKGSITS